MTHRLRNISTIWSWLAEGPWRMPVIREIGNDRGVSRPILAVLQDILGRISVIDTGMVNAQLTLMFNNN